MVSQLCLAHFWLFTMMLLCKLLLILGVSLQTQPQDGSEFLVFRVLLILLKLHWLQYLRILNLLLAISTIWIVILLHSQILLKIIIVNTLVQLWTIQIPPEVQKTEKVQLNRFTFKYSLFYLELWRCEYNWNFSKQH